MVSLFMSAPRVLHWEACLHIVKYLKAHPGCGLFYRSNGHLCVEAFTDADWAGSLSDRWLTTYFCWWQSSYMEKQETTIVLVQKQNIEPWLTQLVRSYGP